jgi:hypothetical protein
MHVDAIGPFLPSFGTSPGPGSTPGATVDYLWDLAQKRIITLTYMRNVHDGCVSAPPFIYFFVLNSIVPRGAVVVAAGEVIGFIRS